MSEKDLVKELKAEIVEITKDRDDALDKMKSKESRMKQVLIKLEHATQDVHSCGHKIGEQNKEIAELAMQFLQRVQLSAQEIPAFTAVYQALEAIVNEQGEEDAS